MQPGLLLESPSRPVATHHLRQRAARLLGARPSGGFDARDAAAAARFHQWQAQGNCPWKDDYSQDMEKYKMFQTTNRNDFRPESGMMWDEI